MTLTFYVLYFCFVWLVYTAMKTLSAVLMITPSLDHVIYRSLTICNL